MGLELCFLSRALLFQQNGLELLPAPLLLLLCSTSDSEGHVPVHCPPTWWRLVVYLFLGSSVDPRIHEVADGRPSCTPGSQLARPIVPLCPDVADQRSRLRSLKSVLDVLWVPAARPATRHFRAEHVAGKARSGGPPGPEGPSSPFKPPPGF